MRPEIKPLARYPVVAFVSCALLVVSFILLLLVGISLSIIKPIYLVILRASNTVALTSIATELRFGVWGVCASSSLNPATKKSFGFCYGPQMGYDVPQSLTDIMGIPREVVQVVQQVLLGILVLHPIAAGFATVSFITSLFLASHAFSIFSLVLTIITAILSSILFAIDLALVIVAQSRVKTLEGIHLEVSFGNGVWLILVSVILTWTAVITLSARACFCMGVRQHPDDKSRLGKFRANVDRSGDMEKTS